MSAITKDDLRRLIDRLADDDVADLYLALQATGTIAGQSSRPPRPLRSEDIVLAEPVMPDDETADDLIATVRLWRRQGG